MNDLKKIFKKLNKSHVLNQWHGYLTPTEILTLIQYGATNSDIKRIQDENIKKKEDGNSQSNHFYFNPRKDSELQKKLDKDFPFHEKSHHKINKLF